MVTKAKEEDMADEEEVLSLVTTGASHGIWPEIFLYHLKFTAATVRRRATLWKISLSSLQSGRPKGLILIMC